MTKNNIDEHNVTFSMIVPIYNCEHFLSRCINSVLIQDYKDFELILVNDGSTDTSLKICEEYKRLDNRIVLIDKKDNTGVSDTRNAGLKIARGKYICFLDADDYVEQGFFSEIIKILEKYPNVDLVNFGMYSDVEDKDNKILSSDVINYIEKIYYSKDELKEDFINLWDNTMLYNVFNKVYKKRIIDNCVIEFPKDYFGEDIKFNRIYLDNIDTMYNSKKCFYHYIREREDAVTKKYKSEFFDIRKNEFFEFNEYFEKWNISKNKYYEYSCRRFIERVLGCVENVYYSSLNFKERYNVVKKMINDSVTVECLKYSKPKSKKIKILLIPIRYNMTLMTMIMGRVLKDIRIKMPSVFNKLKNNR